MSDADQTQDAGASWVTVEVPATQAGRLALMGFPGLLIGADSLSYLDPSWLKDQFTQLSHQGCRRFYSFVDAEDVPQDAIAQARQAALSAGVEFCWLPITDFGTPTAIIAAQWRQQLPELLTLLAQGQLIGLSCLSGIGRSGMMAADLLVYSGMNAEQAILWVRGFLPEAIENSQQESWVGG